MKIVECEKHGLESYYFDDGTVKHTCSECFGDKKHKTPHIKRSCMLNCSIDNTYCEIETLKKLKNNCILYVDTVPNSTARFIEDYKKIKKETPNKKFIREYDRKSKEFSTSYGCYIHIKNTDNLTFSKNIKIDKCRRIWNNEFFGFLLLRGFKIGPN